VRAARAAGDPTGQLALVPASPVVAALGHEVDRLLAERALVRRSAGEVVLPPHLSASRAVRLARDPAELALALRRPVPVEPREQARLGTTFHEWVEQHLRSHALLDLDDLAGGGDRDDAAPPQLEALQQAFLASEWADREVLDVEVDLETSVAGTVLRGRIDAVFRDGTGDDGRPRFVVVDWKTGAVPTGDDLRAAQVQLAVYRLAWARLHGVPPGDVRAAFVHVAAGRTVWLDDESDQQLLERVLAAVPQEG
jgi:DNA helicase-2/ATP-dependent DNA helicase PcrA